MPRSKQAVEQRPVAPNQPSTSLTNMGISQRADEATLQASSGSTQAMGGVQQTAGDGAGRLATAAVASPAAPAIGSPAAPATEVEVVEILQTPTAVVACLDAWLSRVHRLIRYLLRSGRQPGRRRVSTKRRRSCDRVCKRRWNLPAGIRLLGGLGLERLAAPVLLPLVESEQASRSGSELSALAGQEMSPSPAPVIEVIIGRVEVRAVGRRSRLSSPSPHLLSRRYRWRPICINSKAESHEQLPGRRHSHSYPAPVFG